MIEIEELKQRVHPDEWTFTFRQRNEHRLLFADQWARALSTTHARELNLKSESQDSLFLANSTSYMKKTQRHDVLAVVRRAVERDNNYLQYVAEMTERHAREFADYGEKLEQRIGRSHHFSQDEIAAAWREFDAKLLRLIPWFYIPWYITEENLLPERVKLGLERHRAAVAQITDFNHALLVLITPTRRMMFQDEQRDFFTLVVWAQEHTDFERAPRFRYMAEKYLANWAWMTTFVFLPLEPLSFDGLLSHIREALTQGKLDTYKAQEKQRKKNDVIAVALLHALRSDGRLLKDIDWARTFGWVLTWSVETALCAAAHLQPFYKLVANAIGVSFADFSHLRTEEILSGILGEISISENEIKKRRVGYVHLQEGDQTSILVGREAHVFTEWLEHATSPEELPSSFSGMPAAPGIVRGRVRIALLPRDATSLSEGEILVCSMTSPEYVPAMHRAGAIITDEGGLLSHAAIVSREFGKPCIVGTKIATRVLKDGDEVEVDAEKGIVKIIRKK